MFRSSWPPRIALKSKGRAANRLGRCACWPPPLTRARARGAGSRSCSSLRTRSTCPTRSRPTRSRGRCGAAPLRSTASPLLFPPSLRCSRALVVALAPARASRDRTRTAPMGRVAGRPLAPPTFTTTPIPPISPISPNCRSLAEIKDRAWKVQPACATSGDGLWLGLKVRPPAPPPPAPRHALAFSLPQLSRSRPLGTPLPTPLVAHISRPRRLSAHPSLSLTLHAAVASSEREAHLTPPSSARLVRALCPWVGTSHSTCYGFTGGVVTKPFYTAQSARQARGNNPPPV